jgi:hypothetical protein
MTPKASNAKAASWGICSDHCSERAKPRSSLREARLNIIPQKKCVKLGEGMDFNVDIELCAARENNDTNPYIVYKVGDRLWLRATHELQVCNENIFQKTGRDIYEVIEESIEISHYYGGSDACQGDSGGPL